MKLLYTNYFSKLIAVTALSLNVSCSDNSKQATIEQNTSSANSLSQDNEEDLYIITALDDQGNEDTDFILPLEYPSKISLTVTPELPLGRVLALKSTSRGASIQTTSSGYILTFDPQRSFSGSAYIVIRDQQTNLDDSSTIAKIYADYKSAYSTNVFGSKKFVISQKPPATDNPLNGLLDNLGGSN